MPRRLNLAVLLGLIVVIVLSFGLSASARTGGDGRGGGKGVQPKSQFERLQKKAERADGAYKNALFEENQLNDEIVKTREDLTGAEGQLKDAQGKLGDRAKEAYKHGTLPWLDALTQAQDVHKFADVFGLLVQQLSRDRDEVGKLRENRDALQQKEQDLQSKIEDRKGTLEKEAAKKEEAQQALNEAQSAFDSLQPQDRQDIKEERAQSVQDAIQKMQEASIQGDPKENQGDAKGNQDELKGGENQASDKQEDSSPKSEDDRQRQAKVAWAIEETVRELAAQEQPSEKGGGSDGSGGDQGIAPQNPIAQLAVDAAQKQADAQRQAKEAADRVTAEKEAEKKAADEAGAQKAAAQKAAEQAAAQKKAADEAAKQLTAKRAAAAKGAKPQAGLPVSVSGGANGVVNPGAKLVVPGDFSIKPGARVTFEDAHGNRGTAIDGINAHIAKGSIDTTLTGPLNDATGDGQLSTDGLKIVDTSGITDTSGILPGLSGGGAGANQYAPDTGKAAGLQYAPTTGTAGGLLGPIPGAAGLQYAPDGGSAGGILDPISGATGGLLAPIAGTVGNVLAPITGAVGDLLDPASSEQPKSKPGRSGSGGGVIGEADSWLGVPYVHGGSSRAGIDCSAFTRAVMAKFGIVLPDSPIGQWGMGTPVSGPAKAGDLVFWSEDGSGTPTHVGVADGNGNTIHASDYFMDVTVTPISNITGYLGAKRFL